MCSSLQDLSSKDPSMNAAYSRELDAEIIELRLIMLGILREQAKGNFKVITAGR